MRRKQDGKKARRRERGWRLEQRLNPFTQSLEK